VKILYISGTTRRISENKIDNLETKSKIKILEIVWGQQLL
jgi:hypothetical protein